MGLVSGSTGLYWSAEVQLALQNCLSESEHHVLTQEEVEEEAVLWANLKRNLANKALVCLHTLSIDVTDRCCNGIVREQ